MRRSITSGCNTFIVMPFTPNLYAMRMKSKKSNICLSMFRQEMKLREVQASVNIIQPPRDTKVCTEGLKMEITLETGRHAGGEEKVTVVTITLY